MKLLTAFLFFVACHRALPEPSPIADPPQSVAAQWQTAQARLSAFAPGGFVVSLAPDQTPKNQGDSLIWTGVALASMDCKHGAPLSAALQKMVQTLNGGLWRHPTIPADVSLDGALGFYLGVAHRISACSEGDAWKPYLTLHHAIAPMLNAEAGVKLEEPYPAVQDAVLHLVGLADYPDAIRIGALADASVAFAKAPGEAHTTGIGSDACYRAHLALLTLQIIEATGGKVPAAARDGFCAATAKYDLPTADHYCGRGDLAGWDAGFVHDQWQYRHQRCPAWESPDGDGDTQPGVDLLRGLVDAYSFQFDYNSAD